MATQLQTVTPPLKWAGGKRWLLPHLQETVHGLSLGERRLIEPFCGGLAVALGLQAKHAWLNDANPHLINFYHWLQRGLPLDGLTLSNDAVTYYANRDRFNALIQAGQADTAEAAGLFYYLNRTGYNGLCRFNQRGLFNVPFGRYKTIPYRQDFTPEAMALATWQFTCGDFAQLAPTPADWVYADPPYDVPFTTYSQGGFTWADQERLAHWLAALPCPVIASNQATPRVLALYQSLGFSVQVLSAPRRIACTGNRTPAPEMLAVKLP
jgi:DNA adenine methylase